MKVILKEETKIVYQRITHQVVVDIDGVEYIIRNSEDDDGVEYFVLSENMQHWISCEELEDNKIKDFVLKIAKTCYDDFLFSESRVGQEIDLKELNDY